MAAGGAAALAALPPALRAEVRLPLVIGACVRYLESPVGPYDEVLAAVMHRPLRVHVPFLASTRRGSIGGWLRSGRHPGVVLTARSRLDTPRARHGAGA